MEMGPLCGNCQRCNHQRSPCEQVPDLGKEVRHFAARAVQILPSLRPVPSAQSLGPHAAEDSVRIPHESLLGRVRIERGGLERPNRRVEKILQFHIWTNNFTYSKEIKFLNQLQGTKGFDWWIVLTTEYSVALDPKFFCGKSHSWRNKREICQILAWVNHKICRINPETKHKCAWHGGNKQGWFVTVYLPCWLGESRARRQAMVANSGAHCRDTKSVKNRYHDS